MRPYTRCSTNTIPAGRKHSLHRDDIYIVWGGCNSTDYTGYVSKLHTMVANMHTQRFVICPEFPYDTETTGTTGATNLAALNASLKAQFPDNYCKIGGVDLLQNFKNHKKPSYAPDLSDISNGLTPRTLRTDNLHPSGTLQPNGLYVGAKVNADFIAQFIKSKGGFTLYLVGYYTHQIFYLDVLINREITTDKERKHHISMSYAVYKVQDITNDDAINTKASCGLRFLRYMKREIIIAI